MQELTHGLWHWTAPHPDWRPGAAGTSADWERDVGCVLYIAEDRATFFDPLVPEDAGAFWGRTDALVAGRSVQVLTTVRWHARSREEVICRYGASTSRARTALAPSIVPLRITGAEEVIFWLPRLGTLIPGDRLIGGGADAVRVCPQSWLDYLPSNMTVAELRERLTILLELPVERIMLSHGRPVLNDGRAALARALIGPIDNAR